jgi:hypothetical protein
MRKENERKASRGIGTRERRQAEYDLRALVDRLEAHDLLVQQLLQSLSGDIILLDCTHPTHTRRQYTTVVGS